jgi:ankyrin repeat protein
MKHLLLTTIAAVVLVGCGESPKDIWEAAEQGDSEAVKEYLAIGTNVNVKDEAYGGMPLHFAAFRGRKEVAELLINEGADVNAKNQADATPLDKAIEKNWDETVSLLRKHGGKTSEELKPPTTKIPDISIHGAAEVGNIEAVKQHLVAGANVNTKDKWGWTPLSRAARSGHKEAVELLIDNGADVNAKDDKGRTPLGGAIKQKQTEIADLLRKHGGKTGAELKAEGK